MGQINVFIYLSTTETNYKKQKKKYNQIQAN
jgi:hypothetical protein